MPSVRERIMDDIKTALEAITTGNGFNNTIASVQRWEQYNQNYASLPMIVIVAGRESRQDEPNPITSCVLTVEGMLFASQESGQSDSSDTFLNTFYEDIIKKLKEDLTRGGDAVDTMVTEIEPFETAEDHPLIGLFFEIQVMYRHQQTDTTLAR